MHSPKGDVTLIQRCDAPVFELLAVGGLSDVSGHTEQLGAQRSTQNSSECYLRVAPHDELAQLQLDGPATLLADAASRSTCSRSDHNGPSRKTAPAATGPAGVSYGSGYGSSCRRGGGGTVAAAAFVDLWPVPLAEDGSAAVGAAPEGGPCGEDPDEVGCGVGQTGSSGSSGVGLRAGLNSGLEAACVLARDLNRRAAQLLSNLRSPVTAAATATACAVEASSVAAPGAGAEPDAWGNSSPWPAGATAAGATAAGATAAGATAAGPAAAVECGAGLGGGAGACGGAAAVASAAVASAAVASAAVASAAGRSGAVDHGAVGPDAAALGHLGPRDPEAGTAPAEAEAPSERGPAGAVGFAERQGKLAAMLRRERARANTLAAEVQELKLQAQRASEQHTAELRALQSLLADELLMRPPTTALLPPPGPGWPHALASPRLCALHGGLREGGLWSAAVAATSTLSPGLVPPQLRLSLGASGPAAPPLTSPAAVRACELRSPTWGGSSGHTPAAVSYMSPRGPWCGSLSSRSALRDGDAGTQRSIGGAAVGGKELWLEPQQQVLLQLHQQRRRERHLEGQLERLRQEHAEEVALLESKHRQAVQRLLSQASAAQQRVAELMAAVQRLQGDLHVCDQFISWLAPIGGDGGGDLDLDLELDLESGLGPQRRLQRVRQSRHDYRPYGRQREDEHNPHPHLPAGEELGEAYSRQGGSDGGDSGSRSCGGSCVGSMGVAGFGGDAAAAGSGCQQHRAS